MILTWHVIRFCSLFDVLLSAQIESTLKQYSFNINIKVTDVNLIDITQ